MCTPKITLFSLVKKIGEIFYFPIKTLKWRLMKVLCWLSRKFSFIKSHQDRPTVDIGFLFFIYYKYRQISPLSTTTTMSCWKLCFHYLVICRAADWNLNEPTWNGRMRMVTSGPQLNLKLEDKMSGNLFANCPVEAYPGNRIKLASWENLMLVNCFRCCNRASLW